VVNLPADFFDRNPARPDAVKALTLVGVDPREARTLRVFAIESGRFLEPSDGASAAISQTLADTIGVGTGDSFPLPTVNGTIELKVVGILPPRLKPGNEEVLVPLSQAQLMTGETGRVSRIEVDVAHPTMGEAQRAGIQKRIQSAMGDDFRIGTAFSGTEAFASIKLAQALFNLFGVLSLFMGGFIILNTFRTVVAERRHDLGMLRALGATRRTVIGMILAEGVLQGLMGSAVGLALGYLVGAGVIRLAAPMLNRFINLKIGAPVVSPLLVVGCILLGVGVTVLASLLPARSAGTVTPMEAMRPTSGESGYTRRARAGFVVGAACVVIALVAIFSGKTELIVPAGLLFLAGLVLVAPMLVRPLTALFGRLIALLYARRGTADIASANLSRQPSRAAATASSTLLGLAVIVAAGGLLSSLYLPMQDMVRKSLGGDYLFIPPAVTAWSGDVGADPRFAQRLRGIDGVQDVATMRFAGAAVGKQAVSVMGIDPVEFPRVSGFSFQRGNDSAYRALSEGRSLIANGAFLTTAGAKVGATVALLTPNGRFEYRVVASASDLLNAKASTVFISQANMLRDFGRTEDVFLQLNLGKGADVASAERQIKAIAADYPQFQLIRGQIYYRTLVEQLHAAFYAVFVLFAFLALPSLISMINTLSIGVIERTREIGMIRAVGATRRHIRGMVLAEAMLLALIGTVFGLAGGLYLGYAFVSALKEMFPLGYSFPTAGILSAIFFGLVFGGLAAVVPARQAARLEIVEALRYE
jgi:putative ABC transport system permease protein